MSSWDDAEALFYSNIVTGFVEGRSMSKDVYLTLRGVLNYAKITGAASPHRGLPKYDKGPYWSLDITPDEKSRTLLNQHGLDVGGKRGTGKLREPSANDKNRFLTGQDDSYLSLSILENRPNGEKNSPPKVANAHGQPWNGGLIGNGSVADVRVKVVEYDGSEKGVYLQAVRVLKHVPYEVSDFEPLSEDDEFFGAEEETLQPVTETEAQPQKASKTEASENLDDLDDDMPF